MDYLTAILSRAFSNPKPQGLDEDLMRLYRGQINQYASPEALRDVERGVEIAANDPKRPFTITLNGLRQQALRSRGLAANQGYDEIPEHSPTGASMREIINQIITGQNSGM